MHLPFLQVANELMDQAAPDLAVLLEWDEGNALRAVLKSIRWALGRVPEGELPSAHAFIPGPSAAKLIARAAGWPGDADAYVDACEQLRPALLERREGGVRFRGMDRYDGVPAAAEARSNAARHAADVRWHPGRNAQPMPEHCSADAPALPEQCHEDAPTMRRDAKTQTHMEEEVEERESVETEPKNSIPHHLPVSGEDSRARPTAPELSWRDFLAFTREQRKLRGLQPEVQPPNLPRWHATAHARAGPALGTAYVRFLEDPDFKQRGWPLRVFMSDAVWPQRVPGEQRPEVRL